MYENAGGMSPYDKSDKKVKNKFADPELLDFLKLCWDPAPENRATASELLQHKFLETDEE